MPRRRQTEIAIEIDQVITVRRRRPAARGWCTGCGAEVMMVTLDEATSVAKMSTLAILRLVEAHQLHFAETNAGLIRLCLPSLLEASHKALPNHDR